MGARAHEDERSMVWWDTHLFWSWVVVNAAAYLIIVLGGASLVALTSDLTPGAVSTSRRITVIAIALAASALYGMVLGRLQWQVLKQRLPSLPVRQWLMATFVPALIAFTLVIGPEALDEVVAGSDPFDVFKDAFVQAFVLGPLIGVAQATALQAHTSRWKWWFVGNVTSWLFGAATIEAASLLLGQIATYPGDTTAVTVSPAFPLLTVAFHALWMLWVTAPEATADVVNPPPTPGDLSAA
jgi:hypothetical protein